MDITDKKLREVINKLLLTKTEKEATEHVSITDWDTDVKDRAIKMINGELKEEPALGVHGDISDM